MFSVAFAGTTRRYTTDVELLPGGGGGLLATDTCAEPLTLMLEITYVAVTAPLPAEVAVNMPLESTEPIPPVVVHVKGTSCGIVPSTTRYASNCLLWPTERDALDGTTMTEYDGVLLTGGLVLSTGFGLMTGGSALVSFTGGRETGVGEVSFTGGSEVGTGLTAGRGAGVVSFTGGRDTGAGFTTGSGAGVVLFTGGREVGDGLIAGAGETASLSFTEDTLVLVVAAMGAGAVLPVVETAPPLVSDWGKPAPADGEAGLPLVSEEDEADAPDDEGALSVLAAPELAPTDAPVAAFSDAAANARGTAKSSDTNTDKRNNLFIIIPPNTLIVFF
jgi:hypothetical protein